MHRILYLSFLGMMGLQLNAMNNKANLVKVVWDESSLANWLLGTGDCKALVQTTIEVPTPAGMGILTFNDLKPANVTGFIRPQELWVQFCATCPFIKQEFPKETGILWPFIKRHPYGLLITGAAIAGAFFFCRSNLYWITPKKLRLFLLQHKNAVQGRLKNLTNSATNALNNILQQREQAAKEAHDAVQKAKTTIIAGADAAIGEINKIQNTVVDGLEKVEREMENKEKAQKEELESLMDLMANNKESLTRQFDQRAAQLEAMDKNLEDQEKKAASIIGNRVLYMRTQVEKNEKNFVEKEDEKMQGLKGQISNVHTNVAEVKEISENNGKIIGQIKSDVIETSNNSRQRSMQLDDFAQRLNVLLGRGEKKTTPPKINQDSEQPKIHSGAVKEKEVSEKNENGEMPQQN
jgi:hypothetical protein